MTVDPRLKELIRLAQDKKPTEFKQVANTVLGSKIHDRIEQERLYKRAFVANDKKE